MLFNCLFRNLVICLFSFFGDTSIQSMYSCLKIQSKLKSMFVYVCWSKSEVKQSLCMYMCVDQVVFDKCELVTVVATTYSGSNCRIPPPYTIVLDSIAHIFL